MERDYSMLHKRVGNVVHSLICDGYRKVFHVQLREVTVIRLKHHRNGRVLNVHINYPGRFFSILYKGQVIKHEVVK